MEKVEKRLSKIKEKRVGLRTELRQRTVGYVLAGFGFVASLAWNEAIKSFIDQFFPQSTNSILIKFVYALTITVIVVIVTFYLLKLNKEHESR